MIMVMAPHRKQQQANQPRARRTDTNDAAAEPAENADTAAQATA